MNNSAHAPTPGILLITDTPVFNSPQGKLLASNLEQALRRECAQAMGDPEIAWAHLSPGMTEPGEQETLNNTLLDMCTAPGKIVFALPAATHLDIFQKRVLADAVSLARRDKEGRHIFYDEPSPCHPLLLQAMVDQVLACADKLGVRSTSELGLLLLASGMGDPEGRAESYKLTRLLWENVGAARGETAFIRHASPVLPVVLEEISARPLAWVAAIQSLWPCLHQEYAELILSDDAQKRAQPHPWPITAPLAAHPNIAAWLGQRVLTMWWDVKMKTQRPAVQVKSAPTIQNSGFTVTTRPAQT